MLAVPEIYCQSSTAQESLSRERATKARTLLEQVIVSLGGPAFEEVRDSDCNGQIAEFGHNGEVVIYAPFREMWLLPDKRRMEYSSKPQTVITIFDGERGWILDKTGISDQSDVAAKSFAEQVRFGMYNTLRSHWSENGSQFAYAGTASIDLKEVEWIESSARSDRNVRIAIDTSTHLPVQWVVSSTDPETGERTEDITSYARFVQSTGVQTPLRISHTQNGRIVSQISLESCRYNSNLSPKLFTRAALEERQKELGAKGSK
jgi:outer membrane lipoprotein-sorting protein